MLLIFGRIKERRCDFRLVKVGIPWKFEIILHELVASGKKLFLYLAVLHLLYKHLRCETTSAICSKGKLFIEKRFEKNSAAREIARTFLQPGATVDEIGEAGLKLFVMLYGGKISPLRYARYMKMASCSSTLMPEKLPPSERAAWFHALRAYYQVQEWNSLMGMNLNLLDWGWKVDGDKLMPIMTDEVSAPSELLTVIR